MARQLQATISGRDAGGYLFENVVALSTTDETSTEAEILDALATEIATVIIPAYQLCLATGVVLLDIACRLGGAASGYTLHRPINVEGERAGDAAPGALCGVITWLPELGSRVGRIFIPGGVVGDYVFDRIGDTLYGLLQDLGNAFSSWDGTNMTYGWQLGIENRTTHALQKSVGNVVKGTVTALNKRMRN